MLRFLITLVVLSFMIMPLAFGQKFTSMQWAQDLEKLESQVLQPLAAEFAEQPCQSEISVYLGAYLERVNSLRTEVLSLSYVMLRDIALTTGETLRVLDSHLNCEEADGWPLVENLLRMKIEHTSNVLSQLDSAGLL